MNNLEYEHVYKVYNKIAKHFSSTRIIIWPKVKEFLENCKSNTTILDIGCGNSKNMGYKDDCFYIGVDISEELILQTKYKNNCQYIIADCINIPLQNNYVDYIISIAVIHHLSTYNRRLKAIDEISRILKIGGQALIYVWAYEQPKFINEKKQDVFVKWNLQKKYNSNENFTSQIFHRYYHLFKKNELDELIQTFNNLKIIENGIQYYNYYCIIEKIY